MSKKIPWGSEQLSQWYLPPNSDRDKWQDMKPHWYAWNRQSSDRKKIKHWGQEKLAY